MRDGWVTRRRLTLPSRLTHAHVIAGLV